jgi:hypothetical protein
MSKEDRVKRPKLERSEPIRSFSTLLGAGRSTSNGAAEQGGTGSVTDVFTRAVDVGYRVIDEYIRQGQNAAERIRKGQYDAQAATADIQDLAVRMTRSASDLMEMWLQVVARTTGSAGFAQGPDSGAPATSRPGATAGVGGRWADAPRAPGTPTDRRDGSPSAASVDGDAPGTPPDDARLRITIICASPTEVLLDLRPGASGRVLRCHALRSIDADQPKIDDLTFRPATIDEPPILAVRIPPGHPPGAYHGLILDESANRPIGALTIKVGAA